MLPGCHVYSASFSGTSVAVVQDLFYLQPGATKGFWLLGCSITQASDYGDAEAEGLTIQLIRRTAAGSGGSAATEAKHDEQSPTSEIAVTTNRTTVGTPSTVVHREAFNIQAGFFYKPIPEERIWVPAGGVASSLGIYLLAAPGDALTVAGTVTWMEIG